jgi:hypothetical protein
MGVTRRYTRSAVLLLLHRLHNRLILAVYRHLAHTGTSMKGPSPQ